jgi:predicted enzyme related to lactoylglutathione lyase
MYELSHFAIQCDDVERAKRFYESVFAWKMSGYHGVGSDEFQQIATADGKHIGAVQSRKFNPTNERILGFECSISVPDVEEVTRAVERAGGTIVMRKSPIPGVGWIVKFLDTEGNLCCAVSADRSAT